MLYRFIDQNTGWAEDGRYASDSEALSVARRWATDWITDAERREAARAGRPIEVRVLVYRIDDAGPVEIGEIVEVVEPLYPECLDGPDHTWAAPYHLVGGIPDNPGVWGHGGGVEYVEYCRRCGARRHVDTWADDGHGGRIRTESIVPLGELDPAERERVQAWLEMAHDR